MNEANKNRKISLIKRNHTICKYKNGDPMFITKKLKSYRQKRYSNICLLNPPLLRSSYPAPIYVEEKKLTTVSNFFNKFKPNRIGSNQMDDKSKEFSPNYDKKNETKRRDGDGIDKAGIVGKGILGNKKVGKGRIQGNDSNDNSIVEKTTNAEDFETQQVEGNFFGTFLFYLKRMLQMDEAQYAKRNGVLQIKNDENLTQSMNPNDEIEENMVNEPTKEKIFTSKSKRSLGRRSTGKKYQDKLKVGKPALTSTKNESPSTDELDIIKIGNLDSEHQLPNEKDNYDESNRICCCSESLAKRNKIEKLNLPEKETQFKSPILIESVNKIGKSSLLIKWKLLDSKCIIGYEVMLDGQLKNRFYNGCFKSVLITNVNYEKKHLIIIRSMKNFGGFSTSNDTACQLCYKFDAKTSHPALFYTYNPTFTVLTPKIDCLTN